MAGIIAQLTRSARERSNKVNIIHFDIISYLLRFSFQRYYGANKCLYTLERFDPNGFNPYVHNKYVVEKEKKLQRQKELLERDDKLFEFIGASVF